MYHYSFNHSKILTMCGTCGCSHDDNGIKMTIPGMEDSNEHMHEHNHHHHHGHHHHHHHHDHGHDHLHHHVDRVIQVEQDILLQNNLAAARNRGYFEAKGILALNLVSSPGSGKTTLLEKTISILKESQKLAVIEGDQQTSNDAERIAAHEVPVIQINTGKACHLDASMIQKAVKRLKIGDDHLLFIENVGNLVCPAMFDLGEAARVVIMSVTEGDDKAIKYPDMFHSAQLCVINKIDLLPYVNFDVSKAKELARRVNPGLSFIEVSATSGEGIDDWINWVTKLEVSVV